MVTATRARPKPFTLADLVKRFGAIPAGRIRTNPPPGLATEQDVLTLQAQEDRLYELMDGILVDKTRATYESRVAVAVGFFFEASRDEKDLGIVLGADGMLRLSPGQVRIPDVSFIRWEQFPNRTFPADPIASLYPDLAVEVLSESNTPEEIGRKLRDYFKAGTRLVWVIDPQARIVRVYMSPRRSKRYTCADTLDGGDVLPEFKLPVQKIFDRAGDWQGR